MPTRYVGPLAAAVLAAALVVCAVVVVLVRGDEPSAPSVPTPPVSPAQVTSPAPPPEPEPTAEPSPRAGGKLFSCPRTRVPDGPPAEHLRRAMRAVVRDVRPMSSVHITGTSPCADDSGVVVGMAPDTLFPGRRADLQERLSAVAGVPVFVVPQPQEPSRR